MSGNGSVRTALDADSDAARMLLNAYMIEMGLTKYLISKEDWAQRLRPSASLIEALQRGTWRNQKDDDQ